MVIIPHVSLYKKALLVLVCVQEPYSAKKKIVFSKKKDVIKKSLIIKINKTT